MPYLPPGANPKRAKILWELGLEIAGDPSVPYGGNRDVQIVVGSGAGAEFKPSLTLSTGSAEMAHQVARGAIDAAFVNPSAMLTQAVRGVGIFGAPLDLKIIANYPSVDRFVIAMKPSFGIQSLHDLKRARYPLRISLREDPTHSTLVLIDQLLAAHDMSLDEILSWGGTLLPIGAPGDKRRLAGLASGDIDCVLDEGISLWLAPALERGYRIIDLDAEAFTAMRRLGWRRVPLSHGRFSHFPRGHDCLDFSGWPLYARTSLPDETAYKLAAAFGARHDEMTWEVGTHEGLAHIARETDATPMDVPLHPGAARWYREKGLIG